MVGSALDIPGSVAIMEGREGLPMVKLTHTSGASAEVYLFGGVCTSWTVDGEDLLYVRPDAKFDKSKPISGGIPHCFPQFGPGEMQQHGFARNLDWEVTSTSADVNPDDPEPCVELVLRESEYTRAMFDYAFTAAMSITLKADQLVCEMRVVNNDEKTFDFTAALHSYFAANVGDVAVEGLGGLSYLDKTVDANNPPTCELAEDGKITITKETDSVFLGAPDEVTLRTGRKSDVSIVQQGWGDAVVWNPWESMPDSYPNFVCVECAKVGAPVELGPGEAWSSCMTLTAA
jgi:glucose-6-phosphate 1-epimerase